MEDYQFDPKEIPPFKILFKRLLRAIWLPYTIAVIILITLNIDTIRAQGYVFDDLIINAGIILMLLTGGATLFFMAKPGWLVLLNKNTPGKSVPFENDLKKRAARLKETLLDKQTAKTGAPEPTTPAQPAEAETAAPESVGTTPTEPKPASKKPRVARMVEETRKRQEKTPGDITVMDPPTIEMPAIEIPDVEVPDFELPTVEVPDFLMDIKTVTVDAPETEISVDIPAVEAPVKAPVARTAPAPEKAPKSKRYGQGGTSKDYAIARDRRSYRKKPM